MIRRPGHLEHLTLHHRLVFTLVVLAHVPVLGICQVSSLVLFLHPDRLSAYHDAFPLLDVRGYRRLSLNLNLPEVDDGLIA